MPIIAKYSTHISSAYSAEILRHIAQRLKFARKLKKIKATDMARKLDISYKQMQNYETAQCNFSVCRLWQIANLLDVDIAFFFDGLNPKHAQPLISNQELELAYSLSAIKDADLKRSLLSIVKEAQ